MKTILVDAINGLILKDSATVDGAMFDLLEEYANLKIIVTGANAQQREKYNLYDLPYDLFSLEHNPEKSSPEYYKELLRYYDLESTEVICFEHNPEAVVSATSIGIQTYLFDHTVRDLNALKAFLDTNL